MLNQCSFCRKQMIRYVNMKFDLLEHELKTSPEQVMACKAEEFSFCSAECLIMHLLNDHFNVFVEAMMKIKQEHGLKVKEDKDEIWGEK